MKIRFVAHASMIIEAAGAIVWSDPWLEGRAFNDSWALYPPPAIDDSLLESVTHIWISHEHPDHFHLPTLRSLPATLKERVTILFQKNNSRKMFDALGKIGFRNFIELPQRKILALNERTSVYCYQVGSMDSTLAVIADGETLFNINDSELNKKDCEIILKDLGKVDVIFNQFSMAGYVGHKDRDQHLPKMASDILNNVVANHRDLGARYTIPFASMIYYCRVDNAYMNDYANTAIDVHDRMTSERLDCVALYPGESWIVGSTHDNAATLQKYRKAREEFDTHAEILANEPVALERIEQAYLQRFKQIDSSYWSLVRRPLQPMNIHLPDLDCNIVLSMRSQRFEKLPPDPDDSDLIINSQPVWFMFAMPFGCQTLGVSSRHTFCRNMKNWKLNRLLFSMNNAEVYLSLAFFNRKNLAWVRQRAAGLVNQIFYQIRRM